MDITIIETLVSLILLSTIAVGFSKLRYDNSSNINLFDVLNHIENDFTTKNYSNFKIFSSNISVIIDKKNGTEIENLTVQKYRFSNNDLEVFKYEK